MPPSQTEANKLAKQIKMIDANITNQFYVLTKGVNSLNEVLKILIEQNSNKQEVIELK